MTPLFPAGSSGYVPRNVRGGLAGLVVPLVVLAIIFVLVLREKPEEPRSPPAPAVTVFVPSFERLPPVPEGHYEIWTERVEGGGERLGAFVVLPGGALTSLTGEPLQEFPVAELPSAGTTILLTVEPGKEPAEERSRRVVLRGALSEASVTFESALELPEGAQRAILLAPTAKDVPDTAGLWFAKTTGTKGKPASGLNLPVRDDGWAYGGFVTTAGGTTLRTGLFTDPAKPDAGAPFSGQKRGLALPGEDFLARAPEGTTFPLNLADGRSTVAVSLLPDFAPDAAEPYLPLLTTRVAYQQKTNTPFRLEPVAAEEFPKGSGAFERRTAP